MQAFIHRYRLTTKLGSITDFRIQCSAPISHFAPAKYCSSAVILSLGSLPNMGLPIYHYIYLSIYRLCISLRLEKHPRSNMCLRDWCHGGPPQTRRTSLRYRIEVCLRGARSIGSPLCWKTPVYRTAKVSFFFSLVLYMCVCIIYGIYIFCSWVLTTMMGILQ